MAAFITARFAYSVGSKLDTLQTNIGTYSKEVKEIRTLSDGLVQGVSFEDLTINTPIKQQVRHVVVITEPTSSSVVSSTDSSTTEAREMFLPDDKSTKGDTIKKDTIVISSMVLSVFSDRAQKMVTSGQTLSNGNLYSSNVDLAKTLDELAKSNNRLEAEKQVLNQKIAEYEHDLAILKSQYRNNDVKSNKPN